MRKRIALIMVAFIFALVGCASVEPEPLGDGDYVYEISADWGEVGGASYTFRTLPQIWGEQEANQTVNES